MFYPKLPACTTFAGMLTALYEKRYTGHALLQFRNGEAIRISVIAPAVDIVRVPADDTQPPRDGTQDPPP